MILTMYI